MVGTIVLTLQKKFTSRSQLIYQQVLRRSNESIKITVRFLTNQIRADGLKIIVHKKKCNAEQKCSIQKVTSALQEELQVAILKKAIIYEREIQSKRRKRPKKN